VTVFSVGVSTASAEPEAAQALVAYLASAAAQAAKRRHGMEPA
jgi:molybdate transport system substrate-binding protein